MVSGIVLCVSIDAFDSSLVGGRPNKTRLVNILMQLRKCVAHPYLFDGMYHPATDLMVARGGLGREMWLHRLNSGRGQMALCHLQQLSVEASLRNVISGTLSNLDGFILCLMSVHIVWRQTI